MAEEKCSVIGCNKQAEFSIWTNEPYGDAYACTKHVGELLTDAEVHYVYRCVGGDDYAGRKANEVPEP